MDLAMHVWLAPRLLILFVWLSGCTASSPLPDRPEWLDQFPDVRFESATVMEIDGVRCRLLGVAEREHPYLRGHALEFARRWLESNKIISVSNHSHPTHAGDGASLVWLHGGADREPLNCLLVRYGLATVDFSSAGDYSFSKSSKDGDYVVEWQDLLDEARQSARVAKKPYLSFEWPPAGAASQ